MKRVNFLLLFLLVAVAADAQTTNTRAERLRARYITPTADDANRIWIMAHRGAWDEVSPESSIEAYQKAVTYKFEILELDVRFSSPYRIENGNQVADQLGTKREIILQHDKSPKRTKGNTGEFTYGLFEFDTSKRDFPEYMKKRSGKKLFVMLDKLVPYRGDGFCIDGPAGEHPILLKLDGTRSSSRMVHFPSDARINNPHFKEFHDVVKNEILLNFDKLSGPRDFQETYDIMYENGLLRQCIFKAKGIRSFEDVQKLFDNRDLKDLMFTPIFTKYDFDNKEPSKPIYTNDQRYEMAKKCIDLLDDAARSGNIVFPGCEIVYETLDENLEFGWLVKLAKYVKGKNKRVVQFSTNLESKSGAWSGNGNFWSDLIGIQVNYWKWLFNNTDARMENVKASVFVGDKPLEFRSYLNLLGYNQTPIQ
jgi:hypothetical protein